MAKIADVKHPALFLEMRLGKTLLLIRWAIRRGLKRCLIVAPVTVLEAWEKELTLEREDYVVCHGQPPDKRNQLVKEAWERGARKRCWLLTTYGTLRAMAVSVKGSLKRLPLVALMPWDLVGLDESTAVKNPQSITSQIVRRGFRIAKHRALLSGMPDPEGELDLYCQFEFLIGGFLGCKNFWQFRNDNFDPGYGGYEYYMKPGVRKRIKSAVHERAVCMTREQAGISDRKVYETRRVDMTARQRALYKQVEEEWAAGAIQTKFAVVQQKWLCQIASGFDPETGEVVSKAKAEEVVYLLKNELKGQKVVIWFTELREVELVACLLGKSNIGYEVITGATERSERKRRLDVFRQKTSGPLGAQALLATEKVAKFGVDCSVADCAIYYSNEWSCEDRAQSEDRIVNTDKKVDNLVIDLVTRGTIEEEVAEVVKDKKLSAQFFLTNLMKMFWGRRGSESFGGRRDGKSREAEDNSHTALPKRRRGHPAKLRRSGRIPVGASAPGQVDYSSLPERKRRRRPRRVAGPL